eukprot:519118-Amorphochlora_amoeboformis.AAC.2
MDFEEMMILMSPREEGREDRKIKEENDLTNIIKAETKTESRPGCLLGSDVDLAGRGSALSSGGRETPELNIECLQNLFLMLPKTELERVAANSNPNPNPNPTLTLTLTLTLGCTPTWHTKLQTSCSTTAGARQEHY